MPEHVEPCPFRLDILAPPELCEWCKGWRAAVSTPAPLPYQPVPQSTAKPTATPFVACGQPSSVGRCSLMAGHASEHADHRTVAPTVTDDDIRAAPEGLEGRIRDAQERKIVEDLDA